MYWPLIPSGLPVILPSLDFPPFAPAAFRPTGLGRLRALLSLALLTGACARQPFFQPDARLPAAGPAALPPDLDSVRNLTAGRQYARHGDFYQALIGRHHRSSWAAPVAAPVFVAATAGPGGLKAGKLGGGLNSSSLSWSAPDGRRFVLRTVDKDPIQVIPRWLRGSFLTNALRDNISATNPYAALTVPPLAAAVGVPGPRPRLFYVRPDDPLFAPDSLRRFRGQLGLLEEKYDGPAGLVPGLGRVGVADSQDAFAAVFQSPAARLDQLALLRARLLDAWLGDWDRHAGQWSWAIVPDAARPPVGACTAYQPLPKDRDMVFYRLDDGLVGWLVGHVLKRPWSTFGPRYPKVRHLLHNGHYLDVRGLNGLSRRQFQAVARAMQQQLPDTLLARALHRLPPTVRPLEGPRLLAALQARRGALPAFADKFYQHLARQPVVGGTAQAEVFTVLRAADSTVVTITTSPTAGGAEAAGQRPMLLFKRTFFASESSSIRLEGLGGNDIFILKDGPGYPVPGPRLRLYGGPGDDQLQGSTRRVRFSQHSAPAKQAYDCPPKD